jgi:hypothetical protein
LAIPKTFQADFRDVPTDFGDVLGRFQGFSGQISGIFQAYIFSFDNHGN